MDQYNPETNQSGYLTMLTSNNRLMLKELDEKFRSIHAENPIPFWVFDYASNRGHLGFRKAVANMMEETWVKAEVDPEFLAL